MLDKTKQVPNMNKCEYTHEYLDINSDHQTYECPNPPQANNIHCIFHDSQFLQDTNNENEVRDEFRKLLNTAKEDNLQFNAIGFYLHSISFEEDDGKIPLNFVDVTFKGHADLNHMVFTKQVSFSDVKFLDGANFRACRFESTANFVKAIIIDKGTFSYAKFGNFTKFSNAKLDNVNFQGVIFLKTTNFEHTEFREKECTFAEAEFIDDVSFQNAKFLAKTNFAEATFKGIVDFQQAEIINPLLFHKVNLNQKHTIFNSNISQVSFLETPISEVKFGNQISFKFEAQKTSFKKRIIEKFWTKLGHQNRYFRIYDEREFEKEKESSISLESVKNIYRNMIENFDFQLRYDISGEFFVRGMELRRKYKIKVKNNKQITSKKHWFFQGLTVYFLYNILAQYGQSYKRPIYFVIPISILSTLWFWTDGDFTKLEHLMFKDFFEEKFFNAIKRTTSTFFPFYTFDNTNEPLDLVLRLGLLPITGTFFIALKRKLERKLRH